MRDLAAVIRDAVLALATVHIRYVIVGGVGANLYGRPRSTFDVDLRVIDAANGRVNATLAVTVTAAAPTNPVASMAGFLILIVLLVLAVVVAVFLLRRRRAREPPTTPEPPSEPRQGP